MDEDKKIEQANNELKIKEAVANQLESFINSTEKAKKVLGDSYYAGVERNDIPEPLIKVGDITTTVPQPQRRMTPIVRTYRGDVERTVQSNHISSVNIAMAENKRMMGQSQKVEFEEKKSKLNKTILIISIILFVGGLLVFVIPKTLVQIQYSEKEAPVETVSSEPIITVDLEEKVNIKNININRVAITLKERVDQSATKLGEIKNIYLTEGDGTAEKLITSTKFLQLIDARVPSEIQRTLKDPYMFGLYNYDGYQKFLILKVGSYETAFSGMLSWETSLWQDFNVLFNLQMDVPISGDSSLTQTKKFQDAMFSNKDCKVIKDSSGKIIFLYSIVDQNTIVITTSTDTLREIINRISRARVVTQ